MSVCSKYFALKVFKAQPIRWPNFADAMYKRCSDKSRDAGEVETIATNAQHSGLVILSLSFFFNVFTAVMFCSTSNNL
jgi:hypothetical protein